VKRLDVGGLGKLLVDQAEELTRLWRLARASARPLVFPGLLDGVMRAFFERAGRLLSQGAPPEEVWSGLAGAVRWRPGTPADEHTQEWAVAMEVLSAACEAVNAELEAAGWLARAVSAAERGTAALLGRESRPAGILPVLLLSTSPERRRETDTAP